MNEAKYQYSNSDGKGGILVARSETQVSCCTMTFEDSSIRKVKYQNILSNVAKLLGFSYKKN